MQSRAARGPNSIIKQGLQLSSVRQVTQKVADSDAEKSEYWNMAVEVRFE